MSGHVGSTQKSKFLFQEVMTNFHNTYLRLLLLELVEKQIFKNKIQLYYITILAIPISCTSDRREIHFRQHISEFECFMDAIIFRDQVMGFWSAPLINGADRNPLTWEDETPLSVSFCIRYIRDRKKGFVPLCIQRYT